MSQLHIRFVSPCAQLSPYVYKLFVLEGAYTSVQEEMKRISPNGTVKFVLIYKSDMESKHDTMAGRFRESSVCIVGQMTKPTVVDPRGSFGIICFEFYPTGIYRLFDFPLYEITNCFYGCGDIFGAWGRMFEERVAEEPTVEGKIDVMQNLLLQRLRASERGDDKMDYAIEQIVSRHGLVRIEQLSGDVGYSMRHFNRKFQAYAGLSPKELAGLYRFQLFYEQGWRFGFIDSRWLGEYYYDQSHFIREFKKFTGEPPKAYFQNGEQFSHIFYRP